MPWPGHWATTADHPESGIAPGNNEIPGDENDGHAMAMMMRYAQWRATGRDAAWLKPRWDGRAGGGVAVLRDGLHEAGCGCMARVRDVLPGRV